jgi:hypothetical protein
VKYLKKHTFTDGSKIELEAIIWNPSEDEKAYVVTDPYNYGTVNFGTDAGLDHFVKDIVPYWVWGSGEHDDGLENLPTRLFGWENAQILSDGFAAQQRNGQYYIGSAY